MIRRWAPLLSTLALALPPGGAWAAKLDPEACNKLKAEQAELAPKRLREAVEKGPAWTKANLPGVDPEVVRRYIDLEEQLLFRCPLPKPVRDKAAVHAVPPPEDSDGEAKPAPPAKKKPAAEPAKKTAKADTEAKGDPNPEAPVKPKPKPQPKPKPADAFVAPPKKAAE
ncbi:MAG: hypothetical protein ACOYLQ_06750 [Hyphomicrobiaceae bacterium]|jgi:hypothetical protein